MLAQCLNLKRMYPSVRQLLGWDTPVLFITTENHPTPHCFTHLLTCYREGIPFTASHIFWLVTGKASHSLLHTSSDVLQGKYPIHCFTHLLTCYRENIPFTASHIFWLVTGKVSHSLLHTSSDLLQGKHTIHCFTHLLTCYRENIPFTASHIFWLVTGKVSHSLLHTSSDLLQGRYPIHNCTDRKGLKWILRQQYVWHSARVWPWLLTEEG